ncbi:translocation/assembly module TamB domain-containing protein [Nitratireductor kimnyeongensis]|uniref:Translocation/assembly module TamB domain-containing protein n=1 Tax=Nitratireductor kimnyeongensis TaxID=430679 RepID=A0ABW0T8E8_9HYPH|nr:translocation/assembly module TamB domain-containing protein [Nitratireductor kimnyeongensis]QZZ35867.1 translocation/assembly module TamB domain-containing protein [Nitratireductor kimnyeongensis]
MIRFFAALILLFVLLPAMAQDTPSERTPDEERSFFTRLLEDQLSTPNRQIRISGISGALSSQATIREITIADREGIWLRIDNASIDWSRSTLLLRQRLEVQKLAAETILVTRRPLPDEGLPSPESRSFQVPELPLAVNLEQLEIKEATFGQEVFGLSANLALTGALKIDSGTLESNFDVQRLDGPGGQFALDAAYSNETEILDLDLVLDEPANGVVANLLNVQGRPPLKLTLAGSGPLSMLDVKLALEADGVPAFGGTARLREREEGLGFSASLAGSIRRLVPVQFQDFFGAGTRINVNGVSKNGGGILLENFQVASASMRIEAVAETSSDNFLTALSLGASVANPKGNRVLLPVAGGQTSLQSAKLDVTFGEAGSDRWNGKIELDGLQTAEFAAGQTILTMGGLAQNLNNPLSRRISFEVDGGLSEITATQAKIAEALGDTIDIMARGDWQAGNPVLLENVSISGNGLEAAFAGQIDDFAFNGDIKLRAADIAPFSGLADQALGGSVNLVANGTVRPISGAFDLDLDGTATDLRIENEIAGNLLAGTTRVEGGVARGPEGLTARALSLANNQFSMQADGTFATGTANFRFDAALEDMALLADNASGRLTATGRAEGAEERINLTLKADAPRGRLSGRDLSNATIGFDGQLENDTLTGAVDGTAFLAGERVDLSSQLVLSPDQRRMTEFSFRAGGATASGNIVQNVRENLIDGKVNIDAADVSTAAALLLREATGSVKADLSLSHVGENQIADINATIRDLNVEQTRISTAAIAATVEDLFGVPSAVGSINAEGISAGGVNVASIEATARKNAGATDFEGKALLEQGTEIETRGALAPEGEGYRLRINELRLDQGAVKARLLDPTSLLVDGSVYTLDPTAIDVAGGRITAGGRIADILDLAVNLQEVPLSIANTIQPGLGLGGTLDGNAEIKGTRDNPLVNFDVDGREITSPVLAQAGLRALTIDATGTSRDNRLNLDTSISSPEGLNASASGAVPFDDGQLSLDVALNAFPLAALNRVVRGQDLAGQLTGSARVTGKLAKPQASFDMRATGLRAAPLSGAGLGPLQLAASGRYAGDAIELARLTADGPSGLGVEASGTIPLSGSGLGLNLAGTAPLSIANRFLADRGTQLSGTASANIRVSGAVADPIIDGTISTANASAVDPLTNLRIGDVRLAAAVNGDRVTITEGSAALAAGGRVSVSGTISTNAQAGFPADLRIGLNDARHTDGEMLTATVNGALTMTGALTRDPLLAGEVNVERAEILVPESIGGGAAEINVRHIDPPPAVQRTLERARADDGTPMPSARPSVMRLDVNVTAPARIFVRGRGLDAELGGSVRLTGPVTNIQPVGGFKLIRGRLSIIGQRITFDEGEVTMVGDLDPQLDFVARSRGNDIIVFINVNGRVSDLNITFSSQPELPEDEVLARLIFNRGINELSAVQIAQLAAAAAELAGGSNSSLLGSLRSATGLDDLDVVTDSEGNAAVRAGRYIQDNIYLGVEAGAKGTTRGTINLDITEDLKARGAVGSDGDSSLGIFFEKDY